MDRDGWWRPPRKSLLSATAGVNPHAPTPVLALSVGPSRHSADDMASATRQSDPLDLRLRPLLTGATRSKPDQRQRAVTPPYGSVTARYH